MPQAPKSKKVKTERRASASVYTPISFTDYLDSLDRENLQGILHELWKSWSFIRQKAQIPFGEPLGHKKRALIMGCEDSIEMQELRMHEGDILKAVNEFLGSKVFNKLHVELMLDKAPITKLQTQQAQRLEKETAPVHQATGIYLQHMDPNSAIARCYARYLKTQVSENSLEEVLQKTSD